MQTEVLVIACGAIARELVQIKKLNHWNHLRFQCLPPDLHNTPEKIPLAIKEKIESERKRYKKIFVAYADCGTGGALDKLLEDYGIERIPGSHCYEFFTGSEQFNTIAEAEPGSFYLTDFLVQHFERLVIKGLGLDRLPQLKPVYFHNYQRVVYLAQRESSKLQTMAREHAEFLDLDYEYCKCGYTPFSNVLKSVLT